MLYKNAYVYKIYNRDSDDSYFGSSTRNIHYRYAQHINSYNRFKVGKGNYISSFKLLENNMAMIVLMETLCNVTKQELLQCERSYIETYPCINKNIPFRTHAEKLQYSREYHKTNYNIINNRKNEKILCNTCNCMVSRTNVTHHYKSLKHKNNI